MIEIKGGIIEIILYFTQIEKPVTVFNDNNMFNM